MISVEEAQNIINAQKPDWGTSEILLEHSIGEVLCENIYADRDFPPFNRVAMDGISLSFDVYQKGQRDFQIQATQLAGEEALELLDKTNAIEIMTGAILSKGCDLVIRYEDLEFYEKEGKKWVKILAIEASQWMNIHIQGTDQKSGDLLIAKGTQISAAEIAILATVGKSKVTVKNKPKVAIISTGDELVDVEDIPLPHQIRKSNTLAIQASLNQIRVTNERFHLADDKTQLKSKLAEILQNFDVLLLSGGVSKGKADFLPEVLEELNVKKHFHKIAQKPGKPFWFGSNELGKQVFAFPGNPISTYMCFRVYFIPWLVKLCGKKVNTLSAVLNESITFKSDMGFFAQVRSQVGQTGEVQAWPAMGNGSGDLANLSKSDAFIYLPKGQTEYKAGQVYCYFPFDISNFA